MAILAEFYDRGFVSMFLRCDLQAYVGFCKSDTVKRDISHAAPFT
jgi:hypothetical protein